MYYRKFDICVVIGGYYAGKGGEYIGRGLMQLTWQSNYVNYSNSVAEDCHSTSTNREKLERPPHAAKSAGHFWTNIKHLNDEADINDFLKITYLINGGFNGFKERLEILRNAFSVLNLSESSNYIFNQSWIYNNYKASLGWAMWHDVGSNKFLSAMGFWYIKNLNAMAESGVSGNHVDAITQIINLHTDSYQERRNNFEMIRHVFGI